jgi:uncharacterized protein (TIGR03066 family)
MRTLAIMALIVLTITVGGAVSAGKKTPTNKEKIVGTWKVTKGTALELMFFEPVFTFTNDGKFTVDNPSAFELVKGTYEVDGDTLKVTPTLLRGDPKYKADTVVVKIKSLSDKDIVVEAKWNDKTESGQFARVAIPASAKEIAELDKKKLQGTWEHVGTETDGKLVKGKDGWGTVEFKGDNFIMQLGEKKEAVNFLLNATRKLKAIQFNSDKDLNLFAYELEGDRLRLCQASAGQFPEEFKTKGIMGCRIEEFKRVKKGQ